MLDSNAIKVVQDELNKLLNLNLSVDGAIGPNTLRAIAKIPYVKQNWDTKRQIVAALQWICTQHGFESGDIDGLWGPQTDYAYEQLLSYRATGQAPSPWREEEGVDAFVQANTWPISTTEQLSKYYGTIDQNQTRIRLPYAHRLAWDTSTTITRYSVHEKVADSVVRVLERALDYYNIDNIRKMGLDLFGGSLAVRKMRGGNNWSTHSWGIAVDYHPEMNQLKWNHTKALFAKPQYNKWFDFWEEEGWVSLGRARDYDWMHIQAAKVK